MTNWNPGLEAARASPNHGKRLKHEEIELLKREWKELGKPIGERDSNFVEFKERYQRMRPETKSPEAVRKFIKRHCIGVEVRRSRRGVAQIMHTNAPQAKPQATSFIIRKVGIEIECKSVGDVSSLITALKW